MIGWKNSMLAKNPKASHIFMHILLDAKHRRTNYEIMWRGERKMLQAGELLISTRSYAFEVGLSHSAFVAGLEFLRQAKLISCDGSRQGTLVRILDFENRCDGVVA